MSLLKELNEASKMDGVAPRDTWWKSDPDKLMGIVYWYKGQIPPSGSKKAEAYKKIVSQLNKEHPAPEEELERHMKAFD